MRRAVIAVALCAAAAVPPAAGAASSATRTFVLVRTTSGASSFNLSLSASPDSNGLLIGEADTYSKGGYVSRVDSGAIVGSHPSSQGIDAGSLHVRTCSYTGTCAPGSLDLAFLGFSYSSNNSSGDINALYFVMRGSRLQVKFTGTGWALKSVPLAFRAQEVQNNAVVAVSIANRGAAITDGASAPGGRSGSVAVAEPPCSTSDVGVLARGLGRVTLTGGVTSPTFTCPAPAAAILGSYARKSTTWQLTGVAAGDSTLSDEALLVIDTPRLRYSTAR